jgi:hypothetical protein
MSIHDDDDPLWKRILLNELLLALVAAVIIMGIAFSLATGGEPEPDDRPLPRSSGR